MTMTIPILTAEEKRACLVEASPMKIVRLPPSEPRTPTIEELGEEWRRTRTVKALMAWSDAVGRESRRLSMELQALVRRQGNEFHASMGNRR